MPIPANTSDRAAAARIESGQWWALYYTGVRTLVNTAADMAARAQVIRAHNYAMAGVPVRPHAVPPRPTITSVARRRVYWQGSAGAKNYSVEWAVRPGGPWTTQCAHCVTDANNGYAARRRGWYRVVPYNLEGKPGPPSRPVAVA
jgi:hypothetical protein